MEEVEHQDLAVLSVETVIDSGSGPPRYRLILGELPPLAGPREGTIADGDSQDRPSRATVVPRLIVEVADKRAVQHPIGSAWRLSVREDGSINLRPAKRVRARRSDTVSRL